MVSFSSLPLDTMITQQQGVSLMSWLWSLTPIYRQKEQGSSEKWQIPGRKCIRWTWDLLWSRSQRLLRSCQKDAGCSMKGLPIYLCWAWLQALYKYELILRKITSLHLTLTTGLWGGPHEWVYSFYRWGNGVLRRWSDLPKIMQRVGGPVSI